MDILDYRRDLMEKLQHGEINNSPDKSDRFTTDDRTPIDASRAHGGVGNVRHRRTPSDGGGTFRLFWL